MNEAIFGSPDVDQVDIFVLGDTESAPCTKYNMKVSFEKFQRIFNNIKQKRRYFNKSSVNTFNGTLEHSTDLTTKNEYVQESTVNGCRSFSQNHLDFLKVEYGVKKKALFSFPSNHKIYDMVHNQRLTFKLDPCLYLNFNISESYDGTRSQQIYFNVNKGKTYDDANIKNLIRDTIKDM